MVTRHPLDQRPSRTSLGLLQSPTARTAFTLVEVLAAVAILALLLAILLPSLLKARSSARASLCGSNVRQLGIANLSYAADHRDYFVPAAPDVFTGFGGTRRWHGVRKSPGVATDPAMNRFEPARSPLARHFGREARLKECPAFREFVSDGARNAFEAGTGGYGYNHLYVGGRYDLYGSSPKAALTTAQTTDLAHPASTIGFADTACLQVGPRGANWLIEYSFTEPPLLQDQPGVPSQPSGSPSLHFRHADMANVAWMDGHVSSPRFGFTRHAIAKVRPMLEAARVGWCGPADNTLFQVR